MEKMPNWETNMKNIVLTLAAAMMLLGCAKDGSKSHVTEGGSMSDITHTPTDTNMPEVGPKN